MKMAEYTTTTKRWGNSLGLLIPKEIIRDSHIRENEKVIVLVLKDNSSVLKETFGIAQGKIKDVQKIKNRLRRDLYD